MALLISPGTTAVDLGIAGTKRDDISDYLAACLIMANNFAGSVKVGAEFVDSICRWNEDKLNPDFVTDTTVGGQGNTGTTTTLNLSAADAALMTVGTIIADQSASAGGINSGEHLEVLTNTGGPVVVSRAQGGTTISTHAQGAVYTIISRPIPEVTDLGADQSRPRGAKYNYLHRHDINVSLSSEVINRSRRGYTPGIADELEYQFFNRTQEILRLWNRALLYSRPSPGRNGTAGASAGDYSTMAGVRAWLDGGWNSTAVVLDWVTSGFGNGQVDAATNTVNKNLLRQGSIADWVGLGPNFAEDFGKLYKDQIRIQQDDTTRGFAANVFRSLLGNEFRMVMDGYIVDTAGIGDLFYLDSGRIRIRPLADQFYYVITAPTMRDGDSVRAISKLSLEMRNTGTDFGYAHQLVQHATA